MVVEAELRNEIAKVVAQQASLAELYQWLMSRNWNVLRNSQPSAAALAVDVEDLLIEWSNQELAQADVLEALDALLHDRIFVATNVPVRVTMKVGSVTLPPVEIHKGATNRLRPVFAQY